MSLVDVSLPIAPRKDPLEQQVEHLLIQVPKKLLRQPVISSKKQRNLAVVARRASITGQSCVGTISEHRQKRCFKNSRVDKATLDLKRRWDQHNALLASKQQDTAERIREKKTTIKERQEKLNQTQEQLKRGYEAAALAFRAGKALDGLKVTRGGKIKNALKKGTVSDAAAVECTYWSGIGVKCCQMDLESKKLYQLRRESARLDQEVEDIEKAPEIESEEVLRLRNERAEVLVQIREQAEKVQEIERELSIGTLNTLTEEGSQCAESMQKIIKDGFQACVSVKSMVTGIGLVGSLLTFAISLDTIMSNGNSIGQMEADARALQSLLDSPNGRTDLSAVLINNMYTLKLDHLNCSIRMLREEAKSAVATLVSSTLSAGKFSVGLIALATSTILAAPGLNITAVTLAALTSVGLKGLKLYNALKYDKEGVKLDVQIAEESAKIVASSGEFYANAIEFDALRAEIDSLMPLESDIKSSIRLVRSCKAGFKGDPEAEEFYEALEDELQEDLLPISEKKLESQMQYDLLQGELYNMSLHLDQVTLYKRRLQDDRSMEALAAEFSKAIKKGDIVGQYKLFKEVLSDENVRLDFVDFLSREDIPVTSEELIFESVLTFIRNDKHMPRSLRP